MLQRPTPSTYKSRGWINGSHRGIDYGHNYTEHSMEILAALDGTVVTAYSGSGYNGGWGRRIVIDHGHGIQTAYSHMRPGGVLVAVGQRVSAGQLIGRMGTSGAAQGTHLHFELYLNGVRVDPQPYFSQHLPGTAPQPAPAPAPAGGTGQAFHVPGNGQYYYWHYENALAGDYAPSQLLRGGQVLAVVENPGTGPVRVRCADGDLVWVGTRRNPAQVHGGAPAPAPKPAPKPAPAPVPHVRIDKPWLVYVSEQKALNSRGARDAVGTVPAGTYRIVGYGSGKPVRIEAPGQSGVRHAGPYWIGSRHTGAPIVNI